MTSLAAPVSGGPRGRWRLPASRDALAWPLAMLAALSLLHLSVAAGRAINWDEFWFYNQVEELARGTLKSPLQTLHTRLFGWLVSLPGGSVEHILVARLAMFACLTVTGTAIAAIATQLADRKTGLLCAGCYLGAGLVLQHGTSFRVDAMAAALLTGALWVIVRTRLGPLAILAAAAMMALAVMITIKSALYASAFAGVALWQWSRHGWSAAYAARLGAVGAAAGGLFALLYGLHSQGLASNADGVAKTVIDRSARKMFSVAEVPYRRYIAKFALTALPTFVAIALVPVAVLRARDDWARRLAFLGLWLPALVPFFYHNSAPYVYTFLLPPVAIACAASLPPLVKRYGAAAIAAVLALNAVLVWSWEERGALERQRAVVAAARAMFPQTVSYFDLCGMLGVFPKANPFMTPWGIEQYLAADNPTMRNRMESTTVAFVLENDPMFTRLLRQGAAYAPEFDPRDAAAVRDNYVHFWGPFWIAGKAFPGGGGATAETFLVPGPYTVEGGALIVDGVRHATGAVVALERGEHVISGEGRAARLVWGDRIAKPAQAPPAEPYWAGF